MSGTTPRRSGPGGGALTEKRFTGPDLVRDTYEKVYLIRRCLFTTQSRPRSYTNRRRQPLEFEVGDQVFLKVMPKRGVVKFSKRGKLSPRYIRPFKILERVGTIAYRVGVIAKFIGCSCDILYLHAPEVHSRSYSRSGLGRAYI